MQVENSVNFEGKVKRSRTSELDILSYRQPLGWTVWLALPFYLGVSGLVGFLLWNRAQMNADIPAVYLIGGGIFAIVVLSTIWLWFSRIGVDIDRRQGLVVRKVGLFFPLFPTDYQLSEFDAVAINFVARGSGRGKLHEYVIQMKRGQEMVTVARGGTYAPIRDVGEEIARFVNLPLVDLTVGDGRLIDLDARVEVGRRSMQPIRADIPTLTHIAVRQTANGVELRLPWDGIKFFIAWLFIFGAWAGFMAFMWQQSKGNWAVMAFFGAFFGLIPCILYFSMNPERYTVTLDSEFLTIAKRGLIGTTRRRVAWTDIKELGRSFCLITVLSRSDTMMFGSVRATEPDTIAVFNLMQRYWRGE